MSVNYDSSLHLIYFVIAKAFDTVSHEKLLFKLRCIGISNEIEDWIAAYLRIRTFCVRFNSCYYLPTAAASIFLQGSSIGSLLFITYINDLPY